MPGKVAEKLVAAEQRRELRVGGGWAEYAPSVPKLAMAPLRGPSQSASHDM